MKDIFKGFGDGFFVRGLIYWLVIFVLVFGMMGMVEAEGEGDCPVAGPIPFGDTVEECDFNVCDDNIDNDGDGLVDLDDPDCQTCNDGIDNDGDGLTDGKDPDCAAFPLVEGDALGLKHACCDGKDNDGDGWIDWQDPDCWRKHVNVTPPPVGGTIIPVNKLELLTPWIALAAVLISAAAVILVFVKRRKNA